MKIFLDTEFTGVRQNTTLISTGIISDDDKTFYAESTDFDLDQVSPWIEKNVLRNLIFLNQADSFSDTGIVCKVFSGECIISSEECSIFGDKNYIEIVLREWLSQFKDIEVWGDTIMYDWVLFCELFGGENTLPNNILYIPFDIATLFKIKGIDPDIDREKFVAASDRKLFAGYLDKGLKKHNALWDAIVTRACCRELTIL